MRIGSIIMSIFAVIWWIAGTQNSNWSPIISFGIPIAVFLYLYIIGKKGSTTPTKVSEQEGRRIGRLIGIASGVEGILIFVAVIILINIGKSELISPTIAIIVGLHFFSLARWMPAKLYYYTAIVLIAIGISGFFISETVLRLEFVCLGSALTLWITSYILLRIQSLIQKNI